uniref:RNA binding motif protein 11 n=1 Tax=Hucho hucho TaxID=62062 RepID=A0A4W5RFY7_9TELE
MGKADKTVFVANLGSSANEEILFELFLQAGPLKKVTIARDREGRQRSYGFVYYKHAEAVPYAIALLNGTWLFGRQIRLQYGTGRPVFCIIIKTCSFQLTHLDLRRLQGSNVASGHFQNLLIHNVLCT